MIKPWNSNEKTPIILHVSQAKQNSSHWVWNIWNIWKNFQDADELGKARLNAMENFLLDNDSGKVEAGYLCKSLPSLEFIDDQFDLCVCSHLLFLYSEQLSPDFHVASIHELLRIAPTVQIFPLLEIDGKPSLYLELVMEKLSNNG